MSSFTFDKAKVRLPYDSLSNWNNSTRILLTGEVAIAKVSDSKVMIKIGDGSHTFKQLPDALYAKASDVVEACKSTSSLQTFINNLIDPVKSSLSSSIADVKSVADAAKSDVDILKGSDNGKSTRTIASEEVAKIVADAPESFDTLKEISDWISNHKDDAAAMNSAILKLESILDGIGGEGEQPTVVQYITDAIDALSIGDYAKAADLTELGSQVISELNTKVDKEDGKGLSTNDFTNEDKEKLYSALQKENIDQTYNPESENPQSGKAVAQAVMPKQDKTDNNLETTSKNIVGAINENAQLIENIKNYVGYEPSDVVGLQVDFENKIFKRLAGAEGKTAGSDFDQFNMFGGRRRCNVADDGTILAYYGDASYTEDGSNGQVMVYQPKFYYKVVPLKLEKNTVSGIGHHIRKANYYVSDSPKNGFKLHPAFYDEKGNAVEYVLMSAYEGSMYDISDAEYVNDNTNTSTIIEEGDLLCSVAGVKPISGLRVPLNKPSAEKLATNRGSGWHLETIKITSANQLLMIVELGTMNTQTAIGQGVVSIDDNNSYNCSSYTGSTSSLGNTTGQATETINEIGGTETTYTTSGKLSITYRGVENPWGNIWKHIQGINIWSDGHMAGGQPYVADGLSGFNESKHSDNYKAVGFTIPNASGYINAFGYGNPDFDWLLMPSEIGGTSSLPVGDYAYVTANLNGYRITSLGGDWYDGTNAGGFCWHCNNGVGYRARAFGGRLLYVPTAPT